MDTQDPAHFREQFLEEDMQVHNASTLLEHVPDRWTPNPLGP